MNKNVSTRILSSGRHTGEKATTAHTMTLRRDASRNSERSNTLGTQQASTGQLLLHLQPVHPRCDEIQCPVEKQQLPEPPVSSFARPLTDRILHLHVVQTYPVVHQGASQINNLSRVFINQLIMKTCFVSSLPNGPANCCPHPTPQSKWTSFSPCDKYFLILTQSWSG